MAHIWAYLFLYVFSLCKYIFVLYITKLQPHYVYSCACFLFITLYPIDVLFWSRVIKFRGGLYKTLAFFSFPSYILSKEEFNKMAVWPWCRHESKCLREVSSRKGWVNCVRKFLEIFVHFPLHHVIEKGVGIASNKVCLNQKDLKK